MPEPTAVRQIRRDLVIALLALVSVGIGVWELLRPRVDARFTLLDAVDLAIVAVFIADFVVHARRSGDWVRYARRHWWEIPSLVPVTGGLVEGLEGFAVVRGVRLLRLARVVRLLRVVGAAARIRRVRRYLRRILARAQVAWIGLVGVGVVLAGAVAILLAEGAANPEVRGFADALWWSVNLVTTVAWLPRQPATGAGRAVATALMVSGVALVGVFTASLASAIVREPSEPDEEPPEAPALD